MAGVSTSIKLNDMMSPALKKMLKTMNSVQAEFERLQKASERSWDTSQTEAMKKSMDSVRAQMKALNNDMDNFSAETDNATKSVDGLGSSLSGIVATIGGALTVGAITSGIKDVLETANTQNSAEAQLKATMKNMGNADQYGEIVQKAQEIQKAGIYGDEAMIGAGAEFATYMEDAEAIKLMMETLTDYASGMTGGGAIDYDSMVNFATNLGKVTTGSYDAMTKKGFKFTETQKAIVQGQATEDQLVKELGADYKKYSLDMQKALVINNVIAESWDGMYEAMSNTPEASIIRVQNAWGDVKEVIGNQLYPSISNLFDKIDDKLPAIQKILEKLCTPIINIIDYLADVVDGLDDSDESISNIVTTIETVAVTVGTVTTALTIAKGAQEAWNTVAESNPYVLLASILIAVIGSLTTAKYMSEEFQDSVIQGWTKAGMVIGNLVWTLANAITVIPALFVGVGETIKEAFQSAFYFALSKVYDFATNALSTLQPVIDAIAFISGSNFDVSSSIKDYSVKSVVYGKMVEAVDFSDNFNALGETIDNLTNQFSDENQNWIYENWVKNPIDQIMDKFEIYGTQDDDVVKIQGQIDYDNLKYKIDGKVDTGIDSDVSNIAKNTGATAKALEITNEDLKYLRDIAERDVINRFTTASIKVDMTNNNSISSEIDIDGFVGALETKLYQTMVSTAEGVYA